MERRVGESQTPARLGRAAPRGSVTVGPIAGKVSVARPFWIIGDLLRTARRVRGMLTISGSAIIRGSRGAGDIHHLFVER
jgi:hypothetical protein